MSIRRFPVHEYLTVAEAAERLQFHKTAPKDPAGAMRAFIRTHAMPVRRRGRRILIDPAVLATFEASNVR